MITIGILKEQNDNRVSIVPDALPKLAAFGVQFWVESGAGESAFYADADYEAAGGQVLGRAEVLKADLLVFVKPLAEAELDGIKPGTALLSQFEPYNNPAITEVLRSRQLRGFSMDMIPRTTLAQAMDVLSSMASLAGYRSVLLAASLLPRYFPMMITAAGSIKPAKVLVLGAGVAGLQAIATARRLGASVEAFDTRLAAKEEVESLGARFVEVPGAKDDTAAGGYAVAQSEEFLQRQRAEVQLRASKADVVITTAQVRGRKAPLLLPKDTVDQMKPGSVIIDLASSTGGNCELSQDGKTIRYQGITIVGDSDLASGMPQDASLLYSNNVLNFLKFLIKDGVLQADMDHEIVKGAYFTASPA